MSSCRVSLGQVWILNVDLASCPGCQITAALCTWTYPYRFHLPVALHLKSILLGGSNPLPHTLDIRDGNISEVDYEVSVCCLIEYPCSPLCAPPVFNSLCAWVLCAVQGVVKQVEDVISLHRWVALLLERAQQLGPIDGLCRAPQMNRRRVPHALFIAVVEAGYLARHPPERPCTP